jgi:hypothetical protein
MQSLLPSAVPSPHLPVRPDWLDRRREEIIEPDLPIVDPYGLRAPFQDDNLDRDSEPSERQDFTGLAVSVWNPQRQHRP